MKKITLSIAAILAAFTMNAQDSCNDAVEVTGGNTYTVASFDGEAATSSCYTNPQTEEPIIADNAEWFVYTAGTENMVVTITSDLAVNDGLDTRLSIFTGTCDTELSCYAGNDDVNYVGENDPANNLTSTAVFLAEAGVTYYIIWDNQWDATGFDFEVTDEAAPEAPGITSNPTPQDGATISLFDSGQVSQTTGNPLYGYNFTWNAPIDGGEVTNYVFLLGSSNDVSSMQPIDLESSEPMASIIGLQLDTQYYWAIRPFNGVSGAEINDLPVWSFTTNSTLSIENIKEKSSLSHYVANGFLTITAEQQIDQVELYSILGQKVVTEKVNNNRAEMNISSLQSGIYLAKVQAEGKTKTFKFVKK